MITVQDVFEFMNGWAPLALKESWDNDGILVDAGRPVTRVLTALDITVPVIEEARRKDCQLIVSHHPVIFRPVKAMSSGSAVFLLAQYGISAICMHTNLDSAPGGTGELLFRLLGIEVTDSFSGVGRVGQLEPTSVEALAQRCAEVLDTPVKWVDREQPVCRPAVVTGSGGDLLQEAIAAGADCLITGEASHHDAVDAAQAGVGLIAAGHYGTERPIALEIARRLTEAFPELWVGVSETEHDPFQYRIL